MHSVRKFCNFFIYAAKMGDGFTEKLKLLYLFLRWKLIARIDRRIENVLPPLKNFRILFNRRSLVVHAPPDLSFAHIFYQVFIERDCDVPFAAPPRCIVDVGANVGLASLYYAGLYPEATVHAFEPSSANFRVLQANSGPFKNIRLHPCGVYSETGTQKLYLQSWGTEHSLLRQGGAYEEIRTITLDEFMEAERIDRINLLKIDAEGAEEKILTSMRALDRVDHIIAELHGDLIDENKIFERLAGAFDVRSHATDVHTALMTARNQRAQIA